MTKDNLIVDFQISETLLEIFPREYQDIIASAILACLEELEFNPACEVSVSIVTAPEIQALNSQYRNKDSVTDVLSFPMDDFDSTPCMLGDIIICLQRAEEQAAEIGNSLARELAFLAIHACLHLLGYDHETGDEQEKEMFALQDKIMKGLIENDRNITQDIQEL
ncbi:endoribonuclease YbeY [Clostridia bacterium]|nr:endoribonuclease YbeY [Clostridia bacterium]